MIDVRPASRADFEAFYGEPPPVTMWALVVSSSTGDIGFGGYILNPDSALVFSDAKPAWFDKSKRDRLMVMRRFMAFFEETKMDLVATPDHKSIALRHFGFKPIEPDDPESLYRRPACPG